MTDSLKTPTQKARARAGGKLAGTQGTPSPFASTSGTGLQKVEEPSVAGGDSAQGSLGDKDEKFSSPGSELEADNSDEGISDVKDDASLDVGSVENVAAGSITIGDLAQNGPDITEMTPLVQGDYQVPNLERRQGGHTVPDRGRGETPDHLRRSEDREDDGTRTSVCDASDDVSIDLDDFWGESQAAADESSENGQMASLDVAGNRPSSSSKTEEDPELGVDELMAHVPGEPSQVVLDVNAFESSAEGPTLHQSLQEGDVAGTGIWASDRDITQGVEEGFDAMGDPELSQLADFIVVGIRRRYEGLFNSVDFAMGYNYFHSDA